MALERLAPLGDEGGKPRPHTTEPSPAESSPRKGAGAKKSVGKSQKKTWPTRDEREAKAAAKHADRQAEIDADPAGYARQVCLRLLEANPRTRQELARALAKKGVPEEAAEQTLSRFAEVGLIDDALFASMWVDSRHRGRGLAGRALGQELRRKGIEDETAKRALAELDPEQEVQTARSLVRRKLPTTRGLSTEARVRRLAGMLARKGYGPGLAFRIVKEELEREGSDPPEFSFDALQALED